jgi:hypothetical protein
LRDRLARTLVCALAEVVSFGLEDGNTMEVRIDIAAVIWNLALIGSQ